MTSNASENYSSLPLVGPRGIVNSWSSTDVNVHKKEHLWVISNYSFQDAIGKTLTSSVFESDPNESAQCAWYLSLNPKSEVIDKDYVTLHLHLHPRSQCNKVYAKTRISIMNSKQKEMFPCESEVREFNTSSIGGLEISNWFGWPWRLSRDVLFDSKHELIPNDKLIIFCKISYSEAIISRTFHQLNFIPFHPPASNKDLSEDFASLLNNKEFTDVIISVNGTEFPVHKVILAARSPVFSAMFKQNGMLENEKNRVDITDIREEVVEEMLRYIYTGNVDNLDILASELLEAADKYDLRKLKAMCENVLGNNLSIDTAAITLALADLYHAKELKCKAMNYIVTDMSEVMRTEGWKTVASNLQLINEVFQALAVNCSH